ncbi:hypothetical protein B7463_g10389, partial [Scytalidium lignicola]
MVRLSSTHALSFLISCAFAGPAEAAPRDRTLDTRASSYWLPQVKHNGVSPFNSNSSYVVFRDVTKYGAKGDATTDDHAAIQKALTDGDNCAKSSCQCSTHYPKVVYFPPGAYKVGNKLEISMYTQIKGDPTNRPTIKASSNFGDSIFIDGYPDDGGYWNTRASTLNFQKTIDNIIIDSTAVGSSVSLDLVNWAVAQATAIRNVQFNMPVGSKRQGLIMEGGNGGGGSGTYMGDMVFNGGSTGLRINNQQFHVRSCTFNNVATGITSDHLFIGVFQQMAFNNCNVGLDTGSSNSITLLDSTASNTPLVINAQKQSPTDTRSVVIDNLVTTNCATIVKRADNGENLLAGGSGTTKVASWVRGATYDGTYTKDFTAGATVKTPSKPASMLDENGRFITKPKPTFNNVAASDVINVKDGGAKGDSSTDDHAALQVVINSNVGKIIYFPYGVYRISDTLVIPPGSILQGEAWASIRAAGTVWKDQTAPKAVVQFGSASDSITSQMMDFIIEPGHVYEGAKMVEVLGDVAMYDVVMRIGGSQASSALSSSCNDVSNPCRAAFISLHVTTSGSGYFENVWGWGADHAVDGGGVSAVGSGRGALIESTRPSFFVGVAMEHHVFYAFKTTNAQNVFFGMLQTEGPYWQTSSVAPSTWGVNSAYHDPNFSNCAAGDIHCRLQFDMHVDGGSHIFSYGTAFLAIDVSGQENSIWIKNMPKNSIWYNSNVGGTGIKGGNSAFTNIIAVSGTGGGKVAVADTRSSHEWGSGGHASAFLAFV